MKQFFSILLLFVVTGNPLLEIGKTNRLKKDARDAIKNEEYTMAVLYYGELIDSLGYEGPGATMNMANAAFELSYGQSNYLQRIAAKKYLEEIQKKSGQATLDTLADAELDNIEQFGGIAESRYFKLEQTDEKWILSNAFNQRGIITYLQSQAEQAGQDKDDLFNQTLNHLKNALRANPNNEEARYNYELLKKIERERQENEEEDKPEASEFAKQMKALADEKRKEGKFDEAMQIMIQALQQDETVMVYKEFMDKLQKVADI